MNFLIRLFHLLFHGRSTAAALALVLFTGLAPVVRADSQGIDDSPVTPALSFLKNQGQVDDAIQYLSKGTGYSLYLRPDQAEFNLAQSVTVNGGSVETDYDQIVLKLIDAKTTARAQGEDQIVMPVVSTRGDSAKSTDTQAFQSVRFSNVYDGIDVRYYREGTKIEYAFEVAPGADPNAIGLAFDGVNDVALDENGSLMLVTDHRTLMQKKPRVYQIIDGKTEEVSSRYVIDTDSRIAFQIGGYNTRYPLFIE